MDAGQVQHDIVFYSSFAGKTGESMPDREMDSADSRRVTKERG
jgi:hypothetical protein